MQPFKVSFCSFYQECHLPFLHFFQLFSEQFKQVLNQMEAALHSLDPDSSGYILETFLEGDKNRDLYLSVISPLA
ncbi:T7SS effector LXG polymorphic toxin [Psychrobacillus psychrotolerans]|uniref:T7SS effector LXG polymorphic toxin n=1 Tax=Psychrobacillus TaxID=1221880 RepID=UPI0033155605